MDSCWVRRMRHACWNGMVAALRASQPRNRRTRVEGRIVVAVADDGIKPSDGILGEIVQVQSKSTDGRDVNRKGPPQ